MECIYNLCTNKSTLVYNWCSSKIIGVDEYGVGDTTITIYLRSTIKVDTIIYYSLKIIIIIIIIMTMMMMMMIVVILIIVIIVIVIMIMILIMILIMIIMIMMIIMMMILTLLTTYSPLTVITRYSLPCSAWHRFWLPLLGL